MKHSKITLFALCFCLFTANLFSQSYSITDSLALRVIDQDCDVLNNLNWESEPNPANWTGITWSDYEPKRVTRIDIHELGLIDTIDASALDSVESLEVYWNQITAFYVGDKKNLTHIACGGNLLTELDVSGATNLSTLWCNDNQLVTYNLGEISSYWDVHCYGNRLPYSILAQGLGISTYESHAQYDVFEPQTFYKDTLIDYSSEANINGTITEFKFYKNGARIETNNSGLFQTIGIGTYRCTMTNALFSSSSVWTSNITIVAPRYLDVSVEQLHLSALENSIDSFSISSNTSWTIAVQDDWLALDTLEGENDFTIVLTAAANPDTLDRSTTLTISGSHVTDTSITIIQESKAFLQTAAEEISFDVNGELDTNIVILCNRDWEITGAPDWITLPYLTGTGSDTLLIVVDTNPDTLARSATLTIQSPQNEDAIVTITQQAKAYLYVSPGEINGEATGGDAPNIIVLTNRNWEINGVADWITIENISGEGSDTLSLQLSANAETTERSATITVTAEDATEQTIEVMQQGIVNNITQHIPAINFNIYPNPSKGIIHVDLQQAENIDRLVVLNMAGAVVFESKIFNSEPFTIDLSNMNKGLYIIRLQTANQTITQKIIIE